MPVNVFADLPAISSVHLSPAGKRFAVLYNKEDYSLLLGREVDGKKMVPLLRTDNKKHRIRWVRWVNEDKLAISIVFPGRRYGIDTTETRLMKVSFKDQRFSPMVESKQRKQQGRGGNTEIEHTPQFQDDVIDWLPDEPNHLLLAADFDTPLSKGIYKINVEGGRRRV